MVGVGGVSWDGWGLAQGLGNLSDKVLTKTDVFGCCDVFFFNLEIVRDKFIHLTCKLVDLKM